METDFVSLFIKFVDASSECADLLKGCYVIFPYVTIPNVTIPKVIKIPNIYTNPERNNPARGGEKGTKLGEGGRD